MTSRDYWKTRSLNLEKLLHERSLATVRRIASLYDRAEQDITGQIGKVFSAYVRGGALNETKARQLLSVRETEEARAELLEQYRQATGQAKRDIWARLSAPAYANRISRLEALRDRLFAHTRQLAAEEERLTRERLADTLEQSYYRTTYDMQQYDGEAYEFDPLDDQQIAAALAEDWSGEHWSDRIWDNNQDFADAVQECVTAGIMAGLRYDEMRDNLIHIIGMDETEGAKYRAARLVQTECAYAANQGHLLGYQAAGIERYIYLATLDLRTSAVCRRLDRKRFPVAEAQAGTNLPPMHPNCRSTTMPDMSDAQLRKAPRFARDPETGKAITVAGDMSYAEWYKKFVEGKKTAQAKEKAAQHTAADRSQWREYRAILGEDAPKTLEEFQELKYNEPEKWKFVKLDYARQMDLKAHPEKALPQNGTTAVAEEKFTKYFFNPDNPKGYAKGLAFTSRLGYDITNWQTMQADIKQRAGKYPVTLKSSDQYGDRYEQKAVMYGLKGTPANVIVAWIVKPDGETSMTTAYVKEVK